MCDLEWFAGFWWGMGITLVVIGVGKVVVDKLRGRRSAEEPWL